MHLQASWNKEKGASGSKPPYNETIKSKKFNVRDLVSKKENKSDNIQEN